MAKRVLSKQLDLIPTKASLDELREAAKSCKNCDLWNLSTQTVFGEGAAHSELMLVGEQPGDQEDLAGKTFRRSGRQAARQCARGSRHRPQEGLRHKRSKAFIGLLYVSLIPRKSVSRYRTSSPFGWIPSNRRRAEARAKLGTKTRQRNLSL
jgi:hypothetical protein